MNLKTSGYIAHYGVQGSKWGVRKYQYEDKTLTPEGRKRYGAEYQRELNEKNGGSSRNKNGNRSTKMTKQAKNPYNGVKQSINSFEKKTGINTKPIRRSLRNVALATTAVSGLQLYASKRKKKGLNIPAGKFLSNLYAPVIGITSAFRKASDYQSPETSYRIVFSPFKKKKIRKVHSSSNTYMGNYSK